MTKYGTIHRRVKRLFLHQINKAEVGVSSWEGNSWLSIWSWQLKIMPCSGQVCLRWPALSSPSAWHERQLQGLQTCAHYEFIEKSNNNIKDDGYGRSRPTNQLWCGQDAGRKEHHGNWETRALPFEMLSTFTLFFLNDLHGSSRQTCRVFTTDRCEAAISIEDKDLR